MTRDLTVYLATQSSTLHNKHSMRSTRTYLYLVICAQEQTHVGEGARIEGVPDGVSFAVD